MDDDRPAAQETSAAKETIVLVHGTFAGPRGEEARWWKPDALNPFIKRLHDRLGEAAPRCWAHCDEGTPYFFWTGANHWVDRFWAIQHLREHITELHRQGWACHIVGHSHGGNVIAEAMYLLRGTPAEKSVRSVVTLGTPFLDVHGPIQRRNFKRLGWITAAGLLPALALIGLMIEERVRAGHWTDAASAYAIAAAAIAVAFCFVWMIVLPRIMPHLFGKSADPVPALGINSRYDEAWQLLHHIRSTPNPLAVKESLPAYVLGRLKAAALLRYEAAKTLVIRQALDRSPSGPAMTWVFRFFYVLILACILAVPYHFGLSLQSLLLTVFVGCLAIIGAVLLVALLSLGSGRHVANFSKPIELTFTSLLALPIIPNECVTYLVRKQSWTLLQRWALGLDGYRYPLPEVTTVPQRAGGTQFIFEAMPAAVETRAMAARSGWINSHLGSAADLFSNLVLTASDVADLLQHIERDQSLVHAAYYTDDDCVERIARWIEQHSTRQQA
ncbi:hypothetical protein [uncultured Hyphomicrobium sp.]|uniref:esterase/lipase family protein n=1 Tax=uncultured Hyphomicrobium sp. TaxID=194373 RepID=UPI0025ECDE25|nr:hypothetical protein [uncultured Hyphomicrobium sp.]